MSTLTPIITEQIALQGFEVIANRITEILLCEITNQQTMQGLGESFAVMNEDMNVFDNSEEVRINVSVNTIDYQNQTERQAESRADYYIDCYVSTKQTTSVTGSMSSRAKLHRYLGFCRYILSSTRYKRLGFDNERSLIMSTTVSNMQFEDTYGQEDLTYSRMGRLTYSVRFIENQELWSPITLQGLDTTIQPEARENSYNLTLNN